MAESSYAKTTPGTGMGFKMTGDKLIDLCKALLRAWAINRRGKNEDP